VLTREHAIAEYDFRRWRILPDRLNMRDHAQYPALAERMLEVYRQGIGRRRRDLHRDIHRVFEDEPECPLRRIEAFCKLLDDQAVYGTAARRNAASLRRQVFRLAARFHPLVIQKDSLFEQSATDVQKYIADELRREWQDICDELFADVVEFHRLEAFEGYASARALLSRYNVAQIQASLFSAITMTVNATSDFKRILRSARLARLMHTITAPTPGMYQIELTGPASVLRETRRYGVNMARFLPALICCSEWSMEAVVETRTSRCRMTLALSSSDGLQSHLPPDSEFDSSVEADFFKKWGQEEREGWCLIREAEILHSGQKTFVPDFVLQHSAGRRVLMEIVGFWTPEYIQHRLETLHVFRDIPILLAIHESTAEKFTSMSSHVTVVHYKSALLVKQILEVLRTSSDLGT
jgi:predicted nuclease of restriction endonuclease-like RecB superfamily